jgi:2,4-dienoyl-CoA reductase-like NADH-dependent reductase (Old Yellow Enzyme family)
MPQPKPSLFQHLTLPCGVILKNRIVKSAMSDSLGDGTGHPTDPQCRLYQRWAQGGLAAAIIGEVQGNPQAAEKPGNLVLNEASDGNRFRKLAQSGTTDGAQLWLQLGHAGAMSFPPTSLPLPQGPSALEIPGLSCAALAREEILALPAAFAATARLARATGFGGVQIHAAHGFLLSQFLSPLFNQRTDDYGGASIASRTKLLLEVIGAVREAVGPTFPVALKLNATDQLEGGLQPEDALLVIAAIEREKASSGSSSSIDLIDISGGTYFPGAKSSSDRGGVGGPYFVDFCRQARQVTTIPLMATGGFKTLEQAMEAVTSGAVDAVGLARALVLDPNLPNVWQQQLTSSSGPYPKLTFPRFDHPPEGGITAWYTMRLTQMGQDCEAAVEGTVPSLDSVLQAYDKRDQERAQVWIRHFVA